jgi:hypothetical protein
MNGKLMKLKLAIYALILCVFIMLALFAGEKYYFVIWLSTGVFISAAETLIRDYYRRRKDIEHALKTIETETVYFSKSNIVISKDAEVEGQLVVRNDPLWIYKTKIKEPDKLLPLLVSDFESLLEFSLWKRYMEGKSAVYQLYSYKPNTVEELLGTVKKSYPSPA